MGRKNLLKGLMEGAAERPAATDAAPAPAADPPRYSRGAIGAVSRSIADLKARALVEIDPLLIDAGGLSDRLESDSEDDAALLRSISEYGQQVPVLVRPHPETEGRFQIVYGRRRVLALRDLGRPVKALVREIDDRDLVLAQGQENTARRDLSFIEKCNFARQMVDAGFERKVICDALSIDKTLVSRMLSVAERIPPQVMAAIGAAPSVGRDRWIEAADLIAAGDHDADTLLAMIALGTGADTSDARFDALHAYLTRRKAQKPAKRAPPARPPQPLTGGSGLRLGEVRRSDSAVVLRLSRKAGKGFEDWLIDNIAEIHRDWQSRRGE